jgi:hypothetical protein
MDLSTASTLALDGALGSTSTTEKSTIGVVVILSERLCDTVSSCIFTRKFRIMIEEYLHIEPVAAKDLLLGFFTALALKRGRIEGILDKLIPTDDD